MPARIEFIEEEDAGSPAVAGEVRPTRGKRCRMRFHIVGQASPQRGEPVEEGFYKLGK